MARFSSPPQPAFDTADNPDPAAEAGQRAAAATQAMQGVLTTWALHTQRDMSHLRAGQAGRRTDDRTGEDTLRGDRRDVRRALRQETREAETAAVRPLSVLDAGLDSLGPGSVLSETEQAQVRRRFEVVSGDGDVTERTAQLRGADAADEAAESAALLAQADRTPATLALLGGTNRRAARTARVRDALGDVSEVSAQEALAAREDPLTATGDHDALGRDPLTANAWDEPSAANGREGARDR